MLVIIGVIHLLPVIGVMGSDKLESLYQIATPGQDLELLLRHRAVLFGILGAFFCYASVNPLFQPIAFVAAGTSIGSFLLLAYFTDGTNESLQKIVNADLIALGCLLVAVVLYLKSRM